MTTAADEQIREWRERYADDLAAAVRAREQTMAWWAGVGGAEFLVPCDDGGWQVTEAGSAFIGSFSTVGDALAFEIIDRIAEAGDAECCHPSGRKTVPAAAFYAALGVADAARMPGLLGEFLLTADEVSAALPEIERILAGVRREELIERMSRWLGDSADPTAMAAETVDGVVRVFSRAAEQRRGVAAGSAFF